MVLHSIGKEGERRVQYSYSEEGDQEEGTVHLVGDRLMEAELWKPGIMLLHWQYSHCLHTTVATLYYYTLKYLPVQQ